MGDRKPIPQDEILRLLLEGMVAETGPPFFRALVRNLARALDTAGAWVTEYDPHSRQVRAVAFLMNGKWVENHAYNLAGTPCEMVIDTKCLVHFAEDLTDHFPEAPDRPPSGLVSYMGVALVDTDGKILGHLAVMDSKPLPDEPRLLNLFAVFAARATAESSRLRARRELDAHGDDRILNAAEMLAFERRNIIRALDASGWKVAGENGAAHRLGIPPSTLSSRMKALKISRH